MQSKHPAHCTITPACFLSFLSRTPYEVVSALLLTLHSSSPWCCWGSTWGARDRSASCKAVPSQLYYCLYYQVIPGRAQGTIICRQSKCPSLLLGSARGLLLPLSSGVTPGRAEGSSALSGIEQGSGISEKSILALALPLSLAPIHSLRVPGNRSWGAMGVSV